MMKKLFLAFVVFTCAFSLLAQTDAIGVKITGKGDALISLPGFACTGEEWDETVDALKGKYECHVVTYAGFGDVAPVDTLWMGKVEKTIISCIEKKQFKNH